MFQCSTVRSPPQQRARQRPGRRWLTQRKGECVRSPTFGRAEQVRYDWNQHRVCRVPGLPTER
eukprot:4960353-Pleurochrysis_carterae.AAC.1